MSSRACIRKCSWQYSKRVTPTSLVVHLSPGSSQSRATSPSTIRAAVGPALTGKSLSRNHLSDRPIPQVVRSEEHTSELQSHLNLVCRLLLEKNKKIAYHVR